MAKVTKFSAEDLEYIQIITHLMENVLQLDKKVILTLDEKLLNKYSTPPHIDKDTLGVSIRETGIVWLNEKDLASEGRAKMVSVLIHEILHIKFPYKKEQWIRKKTNTFVNVYYGDYTR